MKAQGLIRLSVMRVPPEQLGASFAADGTGEGPDHSEEVRIESIGLEPKSDLLAGPLVCRCDRTKFSVRIRPPPPPHPPLRRRGRPEGYAGLVFNQPFRQVGMIPLVRQGRLSSSSITRSRI